MDNSFSINANQLFLLQGEGALDMGNVGFSGLFTWMQTG
jgi:hypothetical protein